MTDREDPAGPRTVVLAAPADGRDALDDLACKASRASRADDVVGCALELASSRGAGLPRPGHGRTVELWSALATLGAVDLTVARAVEPHLDALAILAEADRSAPPDTTWGVYAAEGPGERLRATAHGGGWVLDGHKPWCSLAGRVSHALITAWVDDSTRRLFAVDLRQDGVEPVPAKGTWVGHGLPLITSSGVDLTGVEADPVGENGWYLTRPGFAWGGIGVAAIWYGGAVGIARRVVEQVRKREPDQIAELHVGRLDLALASAREALVAAAGAVDSPSGPGVFPELLAVRTRSQVADAVDTVIQVADHAMGPAPLAYDAEHAQRVSDLRLYVRQHHAERDVAALGHQVLADEQGPW
ncbi:acyl-CoA dehydrogenase family protein [Luteipulveratus flavus]|uniref:Acyl-CoA dehydrogenase n=1 Tax=Luteipulveratus flavus TaxID=3031728 RepID=A0ABT6C8K1_9MICO|nr:acyl-CoA dehydrogenase [Luteipulveratus sp. YIM 133296]MDF8263621.1 acyl-CoA dehydrogenase [Luteipulveratus sp. YIM 133296]